MAKQDRAVRTRQELIRSAAEAFDRGGFGLSSLTEICTAAGVSSGALHFHFSNKRALGEAVEAAAIQTLHRIIARRPLGHATALQSLVDTTHVLAQRLADDVVLRAGFGLGHDATWPEGRQLWLVWRNWVRTRLTVAMGQGNLASDVRLDDVVSAVTVAVVGSEVLGRADAQWCSRRAVTQFWTLMLPRLSSERLLPADVTGPVESRGATIPPKLALPDSSHD